ITFAALVSGSGTGNVLTSNQNFGAIPGINNPAGTGSVTVTIGFGTFDGTNYNFGANQVIKTYSQSFTNQFSSLPSDLPTPYNGVSVSDGQYAIVRVEFSGFGTNWGDGTSSSKVHISFTSTP